MMEDYYTIQTPGHHNSLFAELHTLQKQGVLCDVVLAAEDGEVMAHKVVLMSASKYFREKLSPTVSANPSRICLKGISVVELANLVKYIYTGKLIVAKETMDVTLEVSEILELNGITQGYYDIIAYEQMKCDGGVVPSTSNTTVVQQGEGRGENMMSPSTEVSGRDSNSAGPTMSLVSSWSTASSGHDSTTAVSSSTDEAVVTASSVEPGTASIPQVVESQTESRNENQFVTQPEQGATTSTHSSAEYSFEFNPYDQQYMDVSVGANTQVSTASNVQRLLTMANSSQAVTDEQARHQDLLAVAIETLSDPSHFVTGINKTVPVNHTVKETVLASGITTDVSEDVPTSDLSSELHPNGKIESKIVTLSAGTVTNELGGQTSVYTVALDPSSIKEPLLMPRVLRKKSVKEKQAEMIAKMYRKKKAELLHRQTISTPVQNEEVDKAGKTKRTPRILLRSSKSKEPESLLQDSVQHILIHRLQDGSVTTTKVTDDLKSIPQSSVTDNEVEATVIHEKEEFGQVVNFDSENEEDASLKSNEVAKNSGKSCSRNITEDIESETQSQTANSITATVEIVQGSVIVHKETPRKELEKEKVVETSLVSTSDVHVEPKELKDGDTVYPENLSKCEDNVTIDKTINDTWKGIYESTADNVSDKGDDSSFSSDCIEVHMTDKVRSSATKRKGKEPRRLDHEDVPGSKKNILIPIVKTRRSSRNESNQATIATSAASTSRNEKKVDDIVTDLNKKSDNDHRDNGKRSAEEKRTAPVRSRIIESNVGKRNSPTKIKSKAALDETKSSVPNSPNISTTKSQELNKGESDVSQINVDTTSVDEEVVEEIGSDISYSDEDIEYVTLDMEVEDMPDTVKKCGKRKASSLPATQTTKRTRTSSQSSSRSGSIESADEVQIPKDLNYFCRYCRFKAGTLACIGKHLTTVHGEESRSKDSKGIKKKRPDSKSGFIYICNCNICSSIKKEKKGINAPSECSECMQVFSAQYDLHVHMVKTHGAKQPKTALSYSCPVCGLVESAYCVIDQHLLTHEGNHISCVNCDKVFKTYSEMKKHQVSHSEKRFKCVHCDFTANVTATVQMHIKLKHSKVKEVVTCQFCDYKTPLPGNMRKHMLTVHNLHIVTKQSLENRKKFKGFEEGQLVTKDLKLFDPKTMTVPRSSRKNSSHKSKGNNQDKTSESEEEKESVRKRGRKPALHKLPAEEFEKEILKRHQEFLKKPEKSIHFMSHALATATGHPSFPQASPNVRQTKADKVYNSGKSECRLQELTEAETQQIIVTDGEHNFPTVGKEIEVIHNDPPITIVTENVAGDDELGTVYHTHMTGNEQQLIVVTKDGKETLMQTKDFYQALVEKESSVQTKETIGVINALLAAGQEVQITERDVNTIEIQNA